MKLFPKLLTVLVVLLYNSFAAISCLAESDTANLTHLNLQLISEIRSYHSGEKFSVAIRAVPEKGWHIYWKYPGDSGTTLKADWSSSFGANVKGPEFPIPERIAAGPLVNFGYHSETFFLFEVEPETTDKAQIRLRVDSEWLVCQEECIPANAILSLQIPSSESAEVLQISDKQNWSEKFEQARKLLPFDYPSVDSKAYVTSDNIMLVGKLPSHKDNTQLTFFPLVPRTINNAAVQVQRINKDSFELEISKKKDTKNNQLQGILVSSSGWTADSNSVQAINVSVNLEDIKLRPSDKVNNQATGLLLTIIFAFIGGLILNLMPCVFPVLTLKIFSLVSKKKLQDKTLHKQSIAFTLGVIFTFLSMAFFIVVARASGEAIGWGFQLQSPGFVACLALLTLIVSLNFLGVFEIGNSLQRLSGKLDAETRHNNQNLKSFLDGVLMTTLATPCTAPFMGSALAYGLSASVVELLAVFTALALGMAAPFVALSHSALLRSLLPKPGAWMLTLKKLLAFPLFATTIWLLWVLGLQSGINVVSVELALFLLVSFFLWLYGEFAGPHASTFRRRILVFLTLLVICVSFYKSAVIASSNQIENSINWEPFSKERVAQLRKENRIVYVDFTAAWCITCQVNKLVAFSSNEVVAKIRELNVATLEADWTNRDSNITQALSDFGRDGVPLNVVYPKNSAGDPEILPQILTPGIVVSALDRASH